MKAPHVFISIVTYNSADCIPACLEALLRLEHYTVGDNLTIAISDNNSSDQTCQLIREHFEGSVSLFQSRGNLGFAGAHNRAASRFLASDADYFLVLNPDLALAPPALEKLVLAVEKFERVGAVTPLLLRANEQLRLLEPATVDSAGIVVTPALRHFDRGAESGALERYQSEEFVFGGTGACLLLSRGFIEDVSFRGNEHEDDLFDVYPDLREGVGERTQLFDEAFFAYREDADLAWRAQRLGWRCLYVPEAFGYHKRCVTPERRGELPEVINSLGVKNRFLLQLNNLSFLHYPRVWWQGLVMRNLLVVLAVLLKERSSLKGLREAWVLRKRARERFRMVEQRAKVSPREVAKWFGGVQG